MTAHTIEPHRLLDGRSANRHQSLLPGKAQREEIGGNRIAQQFRREPGRIDGMKPTRFHRPGHPQGEIAAWQREIGIMGEMRRHGFV